LRTPGGDGVSYYESAADAEEGLTAELRAPREFAEDEVYSVLKSGWPGVVVGYFVVRNFRLRRHEPYPNVPVMHAIRRQFGATPETFLDAGAAVMKMQRRYGRELRDWAVTERVCRELILEQGHAPWVLSDAMGVLTNQFAGWDDGGNLSGGFGELDEWLSWWYWPPDEMPDYLRWDFSKETVADAAKSAEWHECFHHPHW
jgi:hypothetical protein